MRPRKIIFNQSGQVILLSRWHRVRLAHPLMSGRRGRAAGRDEAGKERFDTLDIGQFIISIAAFFLFFQSLKNQFFQSRTTLAFDSEWEESSKNDEMDSLQVSIPYLIIISLITSKKNSPVT